MLTVRKKDMGFLSSVRCRRSAVLIRGGVGVLSTFGRLLEFTVAHAAHRACCFCRSDLRSAAAGRGRGPEDGRPARLAGQIRAIDLLPRPSEQGDGAVGKSSRGPRAQVYEGQVARAEAQSPDDQTQREPGAEGFELNFGTMPGHHRRQDHSRRHSQARIYHRPARAGNDQPRLRTAGAKIGAALRPRDCAAGHQCGAHPRYLRLSSGARR